MGILNRIRSIVPEFRGVSAGPARIQTRRPRPSTDERVQAEPFGGIGGRIWFLPYADRTATGDTHEIRAAMRLMLRDPYVKSGWLSQVLGVLSQDFQVHVHSDDKGSDLAEEQSRFVRHCLENVDGEMVGIGTAILTNLGSDGFSLAEKVWQTESRGKYAGKWTLRDLKPKDPNGKLTLVGDEYRNITGVRVDRTGDTYPISDFTYTRYLHCFDEPYGMAAFRAAYGAYWMRDTLRKLRVIHHQKKASGMLKGTFQDPAHKGPLEEVLKRAASSTWMAVPEGIQVEAIGLSQASEPDYKSFDESLREETLVGIALAHLHILQGGVSDARGDTKVHKSVADLGPWLLTYLLQTVINRQIIPDLIDLNYPWASNYPRVTLGGVTNQEILETLQILEGAQRAGFKPSRSYFANALTIQEADPNDPDDQLQPPAGGGAPGPFGGMGGMGGGFGGGDPFGGGGGGGSGGGGSDPFGIGSAAASAFAEWGAFSWQADQSRTGNVKAVGTGENAGQVLYGQEAEAALAASANPRQGTDPDAPEPDSARDYVQRLATATVMGYHKESAQLKKEIAGNLLRSAANLPANAVHTAGQVAGSFARMATDLPSSVSKEVGHRLEQAASIREPGGVERAVGGLASWIGSLGAKMAGSVIRSLGNFAQAAASDFLSVPRHIASSVAGMVPGVATHIALVAGSAALLASVLYLPPAVPFAAKVMAGAAVSAGVWRGLPAIADRTSSRMMGQAAARFAEWQGPFEGDRGGQYWLREGSQDTPENRVYGGRPGDTGRSGGSVEAGKDRNWMPERLQDAVDKSRSVPFVNEPVRIPEIHEDEFDRIENVMTPAEKEGLRAQLEKAEEDWIDNSLGNSIDEDYTRREQLDESDEEEHIEKKRREFLSAFYDKHESSGRFAARSIPGMWGTDEGGDLRYNFMADNGDWYHVWADRGERAGLDTISIGFHNDTQDSDGVTGSGGAPNVFSSVIPPILALIGRNNPGLVDFSADKEDKGRDPYRRQKLYDRLVKSLKVAEPDYIAFAIPGETKYYYLVRSDHEQEFLDKAHVLNKRVERMADYGAKPGKDRADVGADDGGSGIVVHKGRLGGFRRSTRFRPASGVFSEKTELALAGKDGQRAADLLAASKRTGRDTFHAIAATAVRRLLSDPDPMTAPVLFTDAELKEIANSLAATQATADLLGRARVHRIAERISRRHQGFAESPADPWFDFAEPPPALQPAEAVGYFQNLVPTLAIDPLRYGPRLDRQAFTLATAADETVLKRVQQVILDQLANGKRSNPAGDIESILDAAGVGSRNPQYAEMVYRTNMMDAYTQGQTAELQSPDMQEVFPAWEYHAITDERARPHHAAREGKLYPNSVTFAEVRGTDADDVCNCRCGFSPVDRWDLEDRQHRGQKIEQVW